MRNLQLRLPLPRPVALLSALFWSATFAVPARAGVIEVPATKIEGDPIPSLGYRLERTDLALRADGDNTVLRVEVEITVECRDDQGRTVRCSKVSIYSVPMAQFNIERPQRPSGSNRGQVFYIGGNQNIRLGRITGLGNTEWVVFDRGHRIQATHQSVKLLVQGPNEVAPSPRPTKVTTDDVRSTETPAKR